MSSFTPINKPAAPARESPPPLPASDTAANAVNPSALASKGVSALVKQPSLAVSLLALLALSSPTKVNRRLSVKRLPSISLLLALLSAP